MPSQVDSPAPPPPRLDDPKKSYADAAIKPPPQTDGDEPVKTNGNGITHAKSPGEYEGSGILDAPPSSPPRSHHKRVRSRGSRSSLKINGFTSSTSLASEDTLYESYHHDGRLTSVRPPEDYEHNLTLTEKEKKPLTNGVSTKGEQEAKIASGRVAAAGWDSSGYEY